MGSIRDSGVGSISKKTIAVTGSPKEIAATSGSSNQIVAAPDAANNSNQIDKNEQQGKKEKSDNW